MPDLARDSGEDLLPGRVARDERRHSPQRRLLVGKASNLGPRLTVGDGRGDELCELPKARLGVRLEGRIALGVDAKDAPQPTLYQDRAAYRGAHCQLVAQE